MTALGAILTNTPWWVFLLFALLVFLGVQALRQRTVPLARVFITPAVFIVWGLVGIVTAATGAPIVLPAWVVAGSIGFGLAALTVRLDGLRAERGRATLPASRLPLVRNLLIFAAKYVINVARARRPDWSAPLLLADMAVSGASVGYFVGWCLRFVESYRRALLPEGDAGMTAPRPSL